MKALESLEGERKAIQTETQDLQARRNQLSKTIGLAKAKGEDASGPMAQVNAQADQLKALEQKLGGAGRNLAILASHTQPSAPIGAAWGASPRTTWKCARWMRRAFDFAVKDHVDIGAALGMLDFDAAAKIAGARFSVMKGPLARLHRAIAQLMLDVHTEEHGFTQFTCRIW